MSRFHSYLNSAREILLLYKGEEPFASFIKKYFSGHKKFGSTDRKQVCHLCYCYFRLGKALPGAPVEQRILIALFLCSHEGNEMLKELKPGWNERVGLSFAEKQALPEYKLLLQDIFPWEDKLSESIDKQAFILSHLEQPDLFLRLRPGKEETVKQKLTKDGIEFRVIANQCIALPNSSKIDKLVEPDKEAVVQDYSSQRVGELMEMVIQEPSNPEPLKAWDCCAGSGGKAIMLYDLSPTVDITVSDIRKSILINLEKRFSEAGIKKYKSFIADLASSPLTIHHSPSDLIIADLPCSGSGTWGRTPEQLFYFDEVKINGYAALQRRIISNLISHVKPGGYLLYSTCSVFKKENEEIVGFIENEFHLKRVKMELLEGYRVKADTMFAALFQKTL